MQQFNPYKEFLYGPLEQDELDQLNGMLERDASKDEILLTLHEWADLALDEYEKPMEQCAIGYLSTRGSDQRDARLLVDHDGRQWLGPLHQVRDIGRA